MPRMLLLVCLLLSSVFVPAQAQDDAVSRYAPTPPVMYPGGVRSFRDVIFAELVGFRPLTLDLYLPPEGGPPKPVVVFMHGGAWQHLTAKDGGVIRDFPAVLAAVAAKGYVVASVNYRFSDEVKFPGPVLDVERSIQWLRTHATEYNIDPARFVAWGSSAGGEIATVIGTGCGAPTLAVPALPKAKEPAPSPCVQGVIDWYGLVDVEAHAAMLDATRPGQPNYDDLFLGCKAAQCPAGFARSASPLAYVNAKNPPFLIQHGAADTTVSPKQSQALYDALRAAGVKAEIVMYPGVAHGFAKVPGGGPDDAVNKAALEKVFGFLAEYFPTK